MAKIVITGGSSGLGAAIVTFLKLQGLRSEKVVDHSILDLSFPEFDVRDREQCREAAAKAGRVDILINCAGITRLNFIDDIPEDEWDLILDTNAKGILNMSQAFLLNLSMRSPDGYHYSAFGNRLHGGTILNIISTAAWLPMSTSLAYNASKAASYMMTRTMARELMPRHNITVFGVAPNVMRDTEMTRYIEDTVPPMRGWTREEADKKQLEMLPARAKTDPEQVAEFITFLLQDFEHHRYLAGSIIPYGA